MENSPQNISGCTDIFAVQHLFYMCGPPNDEEWATQKCSYSKWVARGQHRFDTAASTQKPVRGRVWCLRFPCDCFNTRCAVVVVSNSYSSCCSRVWWRWWMECTDDNAARDPSAVTASKHCWHRRHHAVVQVQGVLSVDAWTIRLHRQVTQLSRQLKSSHSHPQFPSAAQFSSRCDKCRILRNIHPYNTELCLLPYKLLPLSHLSLSRLHTFNSRIHSSVKFVGLTLETRATVE